MQELIEKYFKISHDASASLIITLLTFTLGYFITAIVYIISQYFKRRIHKKLFINNLYNLSKAAKLQEVSYTNFIQTLNIQENKPWKYNKVDFFHIIHFQELGFKESFIAFFHGFENIFSLHPSKKLKIKAFTKVLSIINSIDYWEKKAMSDFGPILQEYNTIGNARNKAIDELRIIWEALFFDGNIQASQENTEYLRRLHQIITEYADIPTYIRVNPFFTHRNLVLKIRILNRNYPHLNFTRNLNEKCIEVSNCYFDMENLIRNTKLQYKIYNHTFREFRRILPIIIKILD